MSNEWTITTNNVPRDVIEGYELSAKERAEFNYIDWPAVERGETTAEFFRYRGNLYDLHDADRAATTHPAGNPLAAWDGFYGETFFSAVVFRYVNGFDQVIVGHIYC